MAIALTEEHRELARVARSFLAAHDARAESARIARGAERLLGLPRDPLLQ